MSRGLSRGFGSVRMNVKKLANVPKAWAETEETVELVSNDVIDMYELQEILYLHTVYTLLLVKILGHYNTNFN